MPEGYRGVIVKTNGTEREVTQPLETGDGDEELGEVKVLKEVGSFDKIMAWGHECLVDDDDAFIKGIDEWVGFSQAVSSLYQAVGGVWTANMATIDAPTWK